ncbi:MAG: hypothetical protein C4305_02830, partial [Thermoleophilia bacterium]
MHVHACLDQLGRKTEGLGGRVGVLEAPGIGDESDVQGLGDLWRQGDSQLAQEVADDLSRGGGVGHNQVHGREASVVVVVVDIDRDGHAREEVGCLPHPLGAGAVEGDQGPLAGVLGKLPTQVLEGHDRVLGRRIGVARQVHGDVAP